MRGKLPLSAVGIICERVRSVYDKLILPRLRTSIGIVLSTASFAERRDEPCGTEPAMRIDIEV